MREEGWSACAAGKEEYDHHHHHHHIMSEFAPSNELVPGITYATANTITTLKLYLITRNYCTVCAISIFV